MVCDTDIEMELEYFIFQYDIHRKLYNIMLILFPATSNWQIWELPVISRLYLYGFIPYCKAPVYLIHEPKQHDVSHNITPTKYISRCRHNVIPSPPLYWHCYCCQNIFTPSSLYGLINTASYCEDKVILKYCNIDLIMATVWHYIDFYCWTILLDYMEHHVLYWLFYWGGGG